MSLLSILANLSMDEPSNPAPSASAASDSLGVISKLLRKPRVSVNHRLINLISLSLVVFRTYSLDASFSSGVL